MLKTADPYQLVPTDYFRRLRVEEIFRSGVDRPLEVDLGSGDGTFLVEMAAHFPERNFLAVERLLGRARKICRKAARAGLSNVKVLRLESAYTVEWLLPQKSVTRLHLLFPDPWPKKRHRGRRLVSDDFVRGALAALRPGGEFVFKTDHDEYFEDACGQFERSEAFEQLEWPSVDEFYAETDFEVEWKSRGKKIFEARWKTNAV